MRVSRNLRNLHHLSTVTSVARIFNKLSWLFGGYCSCPSARARNYLQQELPRTQVANGSSTKPLGTKNTNCSPRFIQIAMATGHDRLGVGFIHACHKLLMKEVYDGDGDVVRESLSGIVNLFPQEQIEHQTSAQYAN